MNKYDKILFNWAHKNSDVIYSSLERINEDHNWRDTPIYEIVTGIIGVPSEWESPGPYLEELPFILDDYSEDYFRIAIPAELTAYRLSMWVGQNIPTTHPLVRDRHHWRIVCIDMEFDNAKQHDAIQLITLLHNITVDEELLENLPSIDSIKSHFDAPVIQGQLYMISTNDDIIYLVTDQNKLAAMNNEGTIIVLDYDGNKLHTGENKNRIKDYIIGGMKFTKPITERGELASIVGNDVADMLLGTDGLSVFDIPDTYDD